MFTTFTAVVLAVLSSLVGGALARTSLSKKSIQILIGLGAGMMTSISLTHILPEASAVGEMAGILFFSGFCMVFLLDYFQCTHPHDGHDDAHTHPHSKKSVWNFSGLYIHTFFDGVAIVSAFGVSSSLGIMVTTGVILHQIPVSLSLAAIAQHSHFSKKQTFGLFSMFAFSLGLGALMLSWFSLDTYAPYILAFAGGTLLYIGASDLLPELRHHSKKGLGVIGFFLGGVIPVVSHFFGG